MVGFFVSLFLEIERGFTMPILQIEHLTKDYDHNRGVFDVSFHVEKAIHIQKSLGYLPGEIALSESLTVTQFIKITVYNNIYYWRCIRSNFS